MNNSLKIRKGVLGIIRDSFIALRLNPDEIEMIEFLRWLSLNSNFFLPSLKVTKELARRVGVECSSYKIATHSVSQTDENVLVARKDLETLRTLIQNHCLLQSKDRATIYKHADALHALPDAIQNTRFDRSGFFELYIRPLIIEFPEMLNRDKTSELEKWGTEA